jgi:hypothetical protein
VLALCDAEVIKRLVDVIRLNQRVVGHVADRREIVDVDLGESVGLARGGNVRDPNGVKDAEIGILARICRRGTTAWR